jgi:hypothetical protein
MKLDTIVPAVSNFVTEYNRFIIALAVHIRAEGHTYLAYRFGCWWKISELPNYTRIIYEN